LREALSRPCNDARPTEVEQRAQQHHRSLRRRSGAGGARPIQLARLSAISRPARRV
jgi:hypothetical protein